MNIFITGGSGFIAQHFINCVLKNRLANGKDRIFILTKKNILVQASEIEVILGDLSDKKDYYQQLISSEYVFHFAAISSATTIGNSFSKNLEMTKSIVSILKNSKLIKKLVFTSSVMASGVPDTDYGRSKRESERVIIESGIPFQIFRPCFVYGKGMRNDSHLMIFKRLVMRKGFPVFLRFPGLVSLIDVKDLCDSMIKSISHSNDMIHVATTETLPVAHIFRVLYKIIHQEELYNIRIPRLLIKGIWLFRKLLSFKFVFPFLNYFQYEDQKFFDLFFRDSMPIKFEDSDFLLSFATLINNEEERK